MGVVGNKSLPEEYYDLNTFSFTETYSDFLGMILEKPDLEEFRYDFPVVIPA